MSVTVDIAARRVSGAAVHSSVGDLSERGAFAQTELGSDSVGAQTRDKHISEPIAIEVGRAQGDRVDPDRVGARRSVEADLIGIEKTIVAEPDDDMVICTTCRCEEQCGGEQTTKHGAEHTSRWGQEFSKSVEPYGRLWALDAVTRDMCNLA